MKFPDWKPFLVRHRGLKALSVLLAVLAWYAVGSMTDNEQTVEDIPLTIVLPPGWTATRVDVPRVTVHFSGTHEEIRLLSRESVKATLELRDPAPGEREVPLGAAQINAPGGARVQQVQPSRVHLKLDRAATRTVPVELVTFNVLPEGYEQGKTVLSPAAVEVRGPESVVESLQRVPTVPLDLDGRVQSFKRRRLPLATEALPEGVAIDTSEVVLDMPIVEQKTTRTFENLPVRVLLPPGGTGPVADFTPGNAHVTLQGRPELVRRVGSEDVQVYVDLTGEPPGRPVPRPLRVQYPAGLQLAVVEPAEVMVRVRGAAEEGAAGAEGGAER